MNDPRKAAKQAISERDATVHVFVAALTHLGESHPLTEAIRSWELASAIQTHEAFSTYRQALPDMVAYDRRRLDAIQRGGMA